jgi:hypothetical protein
MMSHATTIWNSCLMTTSRRPGIAGDLDGPLFRGRPARPGRWQQDAYRIIQRRATAAGIETRINNDTFHATGITKYLKNKGPSKRRSTSPTTSHRRQDEILFDEVERIAI